LKKDVELNKYSDELIVRVGGFKRNILLPRQVAAIEQVKAQLDGQVLDICFEGAEYGSQKD
jgi:arsenite-transporting ATPase